MHALQPIQNKPINITNIIKVTVNEVTIDSRYIITRQRAKAAAIKEDVSNISTKEPIEYEFGGVFGAFIMHFASPLGTLFLLLASIKADWSLSKVSIYAAVKYLVVESK